LIASGCAWRGGGARTGKRSQCWEPAIRIFRRRFSQINADEFSRESTRKTRIYGKVG